MNNELTAEDLSDLAAIDAGEQNPDGTVRYLRASEIDDRGARLIGAGLVERVEGHLTLTEAGHVELEERGV